MVFILHHLAYFRGHKPKTLLIRISVMEYWWRNYNIMGLDTSNTFGMSAYSREHLSNLSYIWGSHDSMYKDGCYELLRWVVWQFTAFWGCLLHPSWGQSALNSKQLWYVYKLLQDYMVQWLRGQPSFFLSSPWILIILLWFSFTWHVNVCSLIPCKITHASMLHINTVY